MLLITMNFFLLLLWAFCAIKTPLGSESSQKDDLLSSSQAEGNVGYFLFLDIMAIACTEPRVHILSIAISKAFLSPQLLQSSQPSPTESLSGECS